MEIVKKVAVVETSDKQEFVNTVSQMINEGYDIISSNIAISSDLDSLIPGSDKKILYTNTVYYALLAIVCGE